MVIAGHREELRRAVCRSYDGLCVCYTFDYLRIVIRFLNFISPSLNVHCRIYAAGTHAPFKFSNKPYMGDGVVEEEDVVDIEEDEEL